MNILELMRKDHLLAPKAFDLSPQVGENVLRRATVGSEMNIANW